MNLLIFLSAFIIQYAIGAIIALFPPQASRRVRSALLSGGVCSVSRPTDSDVRRIYSADRQLLRSAAPEAPGGCRRIDKQGARTCTRPLSGSTLTSVWGAVTATLPLSLPTLTVVCGACDMHIAASINLGARSGGRRPAILLVGDQLNAIGRRHLDHTAVAATVREQALAQVRSSVAERSGGDPGNRKA